MKRLLLALAIVLWVGAIILVTLMGTLNPPEEVKFDLSELRAGEIVAGANIFKFDKADFDCSYEAFVDRSFRFDFVLVGIDNEYNSSRLIYLGREFGRARVQWYRAERKIEGLGWFPAAREVRLADNTLTIVYGKDKGKLAIFIIIIVVLFGAGGAIAFSASRD
jgi:hypothetical protein